MKDYKVAERVEAEVIDNHWVPARVTNEGEAWVEVKIDASALDPQKGITSRTWALAKKYIRRPQTRVH